MFHKVLNQAIIIVNRQAVYFIYLFTKKNKSCILSPICPIIHLDPMSSVPIYVLLNIKDRAILFNDEAMTLFRNTEKKTYRWCWTWNWFRLVYFRLEEFGIFQFQRFSFSSSSVYAYATRSRSWDLHWHGNIDKRNYNDGSWFRGTTIYECR